MNPPVQPLSPPAELCLAPARDHAPLLMIHPRAVEEAPMASHPREPSDLLLRRALEREEQIRSEEERTTAALLAVILFFCLLGIGAFFRFGIVGHPA